MICARDMFVSCWRVTVNQKAYCQSETFHFTFCQQNILCYTVYRPDNALSAISLLDYIWHHSNVTFVVNVRYEFDYDPGPRLCGLDLHDKMKMYVFRNICKVHFAATGAAKTLRKKSECF